MNYISIYVLTVIICVKCYNVLTLSKMSCFYNYRTTRARASAESHGNFIRIMEIMLIDIFEYIYIYTKISQYTYYYKCTTGLYFSTVVAIYK